MPEPDATPPPNSVAAPFLGFLAEYKVLLATMVGLGATAAVSSLATALAPPWPGTLAVATLTGLASMVLLASSFLAARRKDAAIYLRRMKVAIGLVVVLALAYFVLWASLVHETQKGAKVVGGFVLREGVGEVLKEDKETPDHLFVAEGYDPERVWTRSSIALAEVALLATWIGFFGSISAVLTTLLLALEAQKAGPGGELSWGQAARPPGEVPPGPLADRPGTPV